MKRPRDPSFPAKGYRGKRKKPTGPTSREDLVTHLIRTARKHPKRKALLASPPGPQTSVSYAEFLDRVERMSCGLTALGVQKGDRIALLSENRPEWTMADFAIMASGAVTVPLPTRLSPQQLGYHLKRSRTRMIFLSQGPHSTNLAAIRDKLPSLKELVFLGETLPDGHRVQDLSLRNLMDLGEKDRRPLQTLVSRITAKDPATIVYTSGTSSPWPKGVVLTHRNFLAERQAVVGMLMLQQGDVLLSFLPLSHILQRVVDMVALLEGCTIAYCTDMDTVLEKLTEFRPHLLVGVPQTYEKIRGRIMENLLCRTPPMQGIYRRLFRRLEGECMQRQRGTKASAPMGLPLRWMAKRAARRIRCRMGGRVRSCFSAGAPLSPDLEAFFEIIRMPLYNAYSVAELTGAVTGNCPNQYKAGTIGIPLSGCELRTAEDGEILVRGGTVTAGYDRPGTSHAKATDPAGWFATGDMGYPDSDGFWVITGRKKACIVTSAGKSIRPQPIESRLRRSPYVQQAMVVGDGRRYLSALIVPSFPRLETLANRKGIPFLTRKELTEHPKIRALYRNIVADANRNLCLFESLKRFALLADPFTQDEGELTSTNRLRRQIIERHYRREISGMYGGSDLRDRDS